MEQIPNLWIVLEVSEAMRTVKSGHTTRFEAASLYILSLLPWLELDGRRVGLVVHGGEGTHQLKAEILLEPSCVDPCRFTRIFGELEPHGVPWLSDALDLALQADCEGRREVLVITSGAGKDVVALDNPRLNPDIPVHTLVLGAFIPAEAHFLSDRTGGRTYCVLDWGDREQLLSVLQSFLGGRKRSTGQSPPQPPPQPRRSPRLYIVALLLILGVSVTGDLLLSVQGQHPSPLETPMADCGDCARRALAGDLGSLRERLKELDSRVTRLEQQPHVSPKELQAWQELSARLDSVKRELDSVDGGTIDKIEETAQWMETAVGELWTWIGGMPGQTNTDQE